MPGANGSDEDVLTYAMFPQVAPKFFTNRASGRKNLGKDPVTKESTAPAAAGKAPAKGASLETKVNYVITLNGQEHKVSVAPEK